MTMPYEEAVQAWGAQRLKDHLGSNYSNRGKVTVTFDFDPGWTDTDPQSYGSFDEPPRSNVVIKQGRSEMYIHIDDFDFVTTIREIIEAGGGTLTV